MLPASPSTDLELQFLVFYFTLFHSSVKIVRTNAFLSSGVGVYGGGGIYEYELELLDDQNSGTSGDPSHSQRWNSLEIARGTYGPDDCVSDVAEIKFDKPVSIREGVKYAVRLRNHGGRTNNGDGGLKSVRGPDGTTFTFSTCSLSFNGTTQTRGQIPHILYYSSPQDSENQQNSRAVAEMQARKCTLGLAGAVIKRSATLLAAARSVDTSSHEVLAGANIFTTLLPLVLAHISPVATSDPRSAIQVSDQCAIYVGDLYCFKDHAKNGTEILKKGCK